MLDAKPLVPKFQFPTILVERLRNEIFYSQGEPAEAAFYLKSGYIKLTVLSNAGKEAVVGILGAGAFFGESCLADRLERGASAIALTSCIAKKIARTQMLAALKNQPQFSEFFLSCIITRKIRLEEDLTDQLCNPCEMRLARILLLLAEFRDGAHWGTVNPRLDQHTLATMVGTTQPRISFLLHRFREQGLIEYVDRLRVNRSLQEILRVPAEENFEVRCSDYPLLNNASRTV